MVVKINGEQLFDKFNEECYSKVSKALSKSNRCMVITGAGISQSAGIPDFRSKDGLFNSLKKENSHIISHGKDLFDANLFKSREATHVFYKFMGKFKSKILKCKFTQTHGFIKRLYDSKKLLRCYTQNIDDLELGLTLNTELKPDPQQAQVVQLHGSMSRVICTLAPVSHKFEFSKEYMKDFMKGQPPVCPTCENISKDRIERGKRTFPQGTLRPDIVLYNEHHPEGDLIGNLQVKDLRKKPDFLLIMGTSLKIPGCKKLVKEAAKIVHSFKNGMVVFVNLGEVSSSEWDDVVDYHFQVKTDNWVEKVEPLFLKYCNAPTLRRSASATVCRAKKTLDLKSPAIPESSENSEVSSIEENVESNYISPSVTIRSGHTPNSNNRYRRATSAITGRLPSMQFGDLVVDALDDLDFDEEMMTLDRELKSRKSSSTLPLTASFENTRDKEVKRKTQLSITSSISTKISNKITSIKLPKRKLSSIKELSDENVEVIKEQSNLKDVGMSKPKVLDNKRKEISKKPESIVIINKNTRYSLRSHSKLKENDSTLPQDEELIQID
ncbi:DHS-like NAD/FAD-binding domain-containing protein [Neoconidiobolus thromboides FSU 785]|nr:DHS-like NAD/FAD-binding domain-containing protein [Neoconidiobolus thromboides FSU 785]